MLAYLFSVVLLSFWTAVGYATLRTFDVTRNRLQALLIAPPIGLVLTTLLVFAVNRAGVPVKAIAPWVVVVLGALAIAALAWDWRKRTASPVAARPARRGAVLERYAPFVGLILLALGLSGRPMFEFGFDWLSYCNEDMANYTMGAQRFLHHGFFEVPPTESLTEGRNYNQNFWFMHARDAQRPGCELLVAWAAGLTGLSVHEVFMPVIIAMHGGLISTASGLAYRSRRRYRVALATGALMAVSALSTFGAMYQLIAQVSGLSILTLLAALLLRPLHTVRGRHVWRYGLLVGIAGAGLLVIYPESSPFLGVSLVGYHAVQLVRRRGRAPWRRIVAVVVFGGLFAAVMVQTYTINSVMFLLDQLKTGQANTSVQVKLFPYYMLPSGLANLWNLQMVSVLPLEPWLSVSILLGLLATIGVLIAGVRYAWRGEANAVVMIVMFLVAAQLFTGRSAFGLYKLAMFLQPFMLGVVALALLRRGGRWPVARFGSFAALLVLAAITQKGYVSASRGAGFAEIRDASEMRLTNRIDETIRAMSPAPTSLLLDASNITLSKFESIYIQGIQSSFPTHDYFANIQSVDLGGRLRSPIVVEAAERLIDAIRARKKRLVFDLLRPLNEHVPGDPDGPLGRELINPFESSTVGLVNGVPEGNQYLIAAGSVLSVVNRFHNAPDLHNPLIVRPMSEVRNHLIFKHSQLGLAYYGNLTRDERMAFFQVERDPLIDGGRFIGVGRYLLFEVVQPTPQVRLVLDVTATLKADKNNALPRASVVGAARIGMDFVGRGAARVVSPPVGPQVIDGRRYIMIDMNEFGTYFPFPRPGLFGLWGKSVSFDHRQLVGFARGISIIGEDDYQNLQAPRSLSTFPADLTNQHLEFSGIYERDGWVSDHSYYMLKPSPGDRVAVRGQVPFVEGADFATRAVLKVDGKVLAEQALNVGDFEMTTDLPPGEAGRRRVELTFDRTQRLSAPDNRPVSAKLFFVGFEPVPKP